MCWHDESVVSKWQTSGFMKHEIASAAPYRSLWAMNCGKREWLSLLSVIEEGRERRDHGRILSETLMSARYLSLRSVRWRTAGKVVCDDQLRSIFLSSFSSGTFKVHRPREFAFLNLTSLSLSYSLKPCALAPMRAEANEYICLFVCLYNFKLFFFNVVIFRSRESQ